MATIPSSALSPMFSRATGKPNGLTPLAVGKITGRMILQDGAQGGKDEFNMDTLSVPYKIFAGDDWENLLPSRGDPSKDFQNMVVWDPCVTFTVGRMFVDVRMLLRGLRNQNGANNTWNGFTLNPKPRDAVGIGQAQITGTDGESILDIVYYRPQTTYRYVTTSSIVAAPQVINNPTQRQPQIISFAVRGSGDTPQGTYKNGAVAAVNGFQFFSRQRCTELSTVQVGNYFQNEATVVYEFYGGGQAS